MLLEQLTRFAVACPTKSFFGIPTWYKYLESETDLVDPSKCVPKIDLTKNPQELLLIGLAVIDMLLYLAGILAVGYIMYGAFLYMTSEGQPDRTGAAKSTILNAVIGLVVVLLAITIVGFVGSKFT